MSDISEATTGVRVRQMAGEDVEGILAIERKVSGELRAPTYAPVPDSCIGGEVENSLVAEKDDQIVGFLLGRIARSPTALLDVAWIELIGVLPEYMHQGVGKKLVESWKEHCRRKGIKKVHAMISWRDWLMLSFFESQGFTRGDLTDFQFEL